MIENLMRRLIAKFMLITVGMNWSKDAIHPELFKKIQNFEDNDPYLNDLHKLNFIHLSQVLFEKKRDITLEELDRILTKTKFDDDDKERILKYIPRSNWEKYFSALVEEKDHSLEKKWELLYNLRNKVAHNRNVKKSEFEQIKGLSSNIKDIINKATTKLGEIDINEEDRELIKYSYQPDSPAAIGYLSEKAVIDYYIKHGYNVTHPTDSTFTRIFDFVAEKDGKSISVVVKTLGSRAARLLVPNMLSVMTSTQKLNPDNGIPNDIHMVCVLHGATSPPIDSLIHKISEILQESEKNVEVHIGRLDDEYHYTPI